MSRAFIHYLAAHLPGDFGQLTLCAQLGKLSLIVRIGDRSRPQTIAQAEADIIGPHDFAYFAKSRVEKALAVMREAPLGHYRASSRNNPGNAVCGQWDVTQQHACVNGEIV